MSWDLTQTEIDFLSRVGAFAWTDVADWLTKSEVYGYFQEAALRLAELGLFVSREIVSVPGTPTPVLALPADWIDSIHVSVNGQQLRPTSAAELLAYDSLWPETLCSPGVLPSRYSMDAGPLGTVTLYPVQSSSAELETISHVTPAAVSTTQTTVPIPGVVADYFLYFALARARGKESPYAMPEVVSAAQSMISLYEQVFTTYWGGLE
jgi:hypothetical protein